MDRLSDAAIEIINTLHRERIDYNSEYLPLIDAANRLSAYEDTGLEPEEIEKAMAISALREQEERENPKPLTLDELREMDGEPVFLVDLVHKEDPRVPDLWTGWIIFSHHFDDGFVPKGGNGWFSVCGYGKRWLAYRHKPKGDSK